MNDFVRLFKQIDSTTKTNAKIQALVEYFNNAKDIDKLWTVAIFTHRRPPRAVNTTLLRTWAAEVSNIPLWLFEDSYHIVGDLAETIALVLPNQPSKDIDSLATIMQELLDLKKQDEHYKKSYVLEKWQSMDADQRFVFNKFITGGFRLGVSQKTIIKALTIYTGDDENILAHRLMGNWSPTSHTWHELIISPTEGEDLSKPYPFYLAYAIDIGVAQIGAPSQWNAEWKWDGIRGQIIKRGSEVFVWSRGEDLITDKFPEFQELKDEQENDFVLDGEIIPILDGKIQNFQLLQTRIGRKNVTKKYLRDCPIYMIAYDLLEYQGEDIRSTPLTERQALLSKLVSSFESNRILVSSPLTFDSWEDLTDQRTKSRAFDAEGLMLKRKDSIYGVGRKKGDWWKWKVDPYEVDAVMIYAQRGHGRRANLYTDFTFAVWDGDILIPFTKAYSGLTDVEFREVTNFVRKNTIEKFGPVVSVSPELVFTIAFEGIAKSSRHKSGVALRFPRISRWRKDKVAGDADHISSLYSLLNY